MSGPRISLCFVLPGTDREPMSPPLPAGYRRELHGLRGVAIGMVVVYHVFLGRVSGGVDVFLMISAFLMTGSFADRLARGRRPGIGAYCAKAFKRLLPPAVVTILLTVLLAQAFLPPYRLRGVLDDAVASVTYTQNWHLAAEAVDYYALDRSEASPLQHFWSLSVQGQIFLLWPLLMALGWLLVRWRGWDARRTLTVIFGVTFATSLAWSVWSTANNQTLAYFDTRARAWEFALGSLLALVLPLIERRFGFGPGTQPQTAGLRSARVLLGWSGLLSMLAVGFVVDVTGAFPGWIALWPTLAACLVIGAGRTWSVLGVDTLLASRPLAWLGDISYCLYLVHWPLLVTLLVVRDGQPATLSEGALLVAVSLLLAQLLTAWVDVPIRRSAWLGARTWRQVAVIVLFLVVGLAPVLAVQARLDRQRAQAIDRIIGNNPGAGALLGDWGGPDDPAAPVLPLPQDLTFDWVELDKDCDASLLPASELLAEGCRQSAGGDPDKLIVVIGSSRIEQLMGALKPLAVAHDHTIVAVLLDGCPLGVEDYFTECDQWQAEVLDYLEELRPAAVFTHTTSIAEEEFVPPGMGEAISRLSAAGIDIIGIRDQPRIPDEPEACTDQPMGADCVIGTEEIFAADDINADLAEYATGPGTLYSLDLTPWICPDGYCRPVVGNVYVYLNQSHISQLYATSLAPILDMELQAAGFTWR